MNKERDPEKEMEISARIAKASAREKERENRYKLVEEDRLTAEASGSALHKDQSRYEKYLYVPPHQRATDGNEEPEGGGDRRRGGPPSRANNGFAPHHDDRDRFRDAPQRGGGRRPPRGRRGGGRGREAPGGHPHPHPHSQHAYPQADQKWLDERVQADSARLESNKSADGQWKREFDRGKKIPFASTRQMNEDGEYAQRSNRSGGRRRGGGPPGASNFRGRGRGGGGVGRGGGGDGEEEIIPPRQRQIQLEDDAVTVTVSNDGVGRPRGGRNNFRGASRSSESSTEAGDPPVSGRPRAKGSEGGRRSSNRRWPRRGRGGRSAREVRQPTRPRDAEVNGRDEAVVEATANGDDESGIPLSDVGLVEEAEVEDEYIDDTLEDLEDLDQYRLKIDLNEFTVDNPDLPDPILKKPMEFSWARAVSEEEKCQARGEAAPQYSGPVEVVWYDELDGERVRETYHSHPKTAAETETKATEMACVPEEEAGNFDEESHEEGERKEVSEIADVQSDKASKCEGNDDSGTLSSRDVAENDSIQDAKEDVENVQIEEESSDIAKDDLRENEDLKTCNDAENDDTEDTNEGVDNIQNKEESSNIVKDGQRENEDLKTCTNNDCNDTKNDNTENTKEGVDHIQNEEESDIVKSDKPENEELKNDAPSSTPDIPTGDLKVEFVSSQSVEVAESNSVKNDVSDSGTTPESDHVCSDK